MHCPQITSRHWLPGLLLFGLIGCAAPPKVLPHAAHGHKGEVQTQGIITEHKLSPIPAMNRGQRTTYRITPLSGSASAVVF